MSCLTCACIPCTNIIITRVGCKEIAAVWYFWHGFIHRGTFSKLSVTSPMSQLNLQPLHHFTYVTAQSPTLPLLQLCHSLISNPSITLPTSQLDLQPFHCFSYVTAQSPTLPLLHLCHSSFSNPSVALPMSQFVLQPFHCFIYITAHSPTLLMLLLRHRLFTWRAAHVLQTLRRSFKQIFWNCIFLKLSL